MLLNFSVLKLYLFLLIIVTSQITTAAWAITIHVLPLDVDVGVAHHDVLEVGGGHEPAIALDEESVAAVAAVVVPKPGAPVDTMKGI